MVKQRTVRLAVRRIIQIVTVKEVAASWIALDCLDSGLDAYPGSYSMWPVSVRLQRCFGAGDVPA